MQIGADILRRNPGCYLHIIEQNCICRTNASDRYNRHDQYGYQYRNGHNIKMNLLFQITLFFHDITPCIIKIYSLSG